MGLRLYAMTCGWLTMPFKFFLQDGDGWLAIPIPSYLIVHPKGSVLFDTGLETSLQTTNPGDFKRVLGSIERFVKPDFKPGENVAERLRAFGVDPDKIEYLINSHLHFDYCGGNALIKNARLIIQKKEWVAATTPETIAENTYFPHQYDIGHDRMLVDGEHDLFGDGSVVLFPTHGHTPGHQSLKVKLVDGDVVLSADACYMRKTLEQLILPDPLLVRDPEAMKVALARIYKYQEDGALIIFGHDPD